MKNYLFLILWISAFTVSAQKLKPGFDKNEYLNLLMIFNRKYPNYGSDTSGDGQAISSSVKYIKIYQSEEVGLKNRWSLWYEKNQELAIINIRGTVASNISWMENFYAAMVPATGSLQLNDSTSFKYQLARNPQAMVHVGWLLGLAYLAPGILKKIHETYSKGIKEFIIFGHSQGASIAYLLRSYLEYQTKAGFLPKDILYKTYCSAAPKPGNGYYAYDFDYITRSGWGFTVINPADWVPKTPFSVQTLKDFPHIQPFKDVSSMFKNQPALVRWVLQSKFTSLNKKTSQAQKKLQKILGKQVYKQLKKTLPQFREPDYAEGNNYQRAGQTIILMPDEEYYRKFPDTSSNVFIHHQQSAYFYLAEKYAP